MSSSDTPVLTTSPRRRYLIGTGYVANAKTPISASEFYDVWLANTLKAHPSQIFVVGANGDKPSAPHGYVTKGEITQFYNGLGDLGHIRDKHEGRTNFPFTGWAGAMMLAAFAAYNECLDFIYKEQDCLAFGNWVEQLYNDMGDGSAVLGKGLKPPHNQLQSSQSLFLVRHEAIPCFVSLYIAAGEDQAQGPTTGENKFKRMIEAHPTHYKVQSGHWNMDRDRPLPYHQGTWAAQQITSKEFHIMKGLGLI